MKLIIQSAGKNDGNTAGLFLNDGPNLFQPSTGLNLILFNEKTFEVVEQYGYNTHEIEQDAVALSDKLTALKNATSIIVCLAVMDSAHSHLNTPISGSSLIGQLTSMGSKYIEEVGDRDSWAMMFKKKNNAYQVLFEGYRPTNRGVVKGAPMAKGYIKFRESIDSDQNTTSLEKGAIANATIGIRSHVGYLAEEIDKGKLVMAPIRLNPPSWNDPHAFVAQQTSIIIDAGPNFIADQSKVDYQLHRDDILIHTFRNQEAQKFIDIEKERNVVYNYDMRTFNAKNGVFTSRIRQKDIVPQPQLVRFNQFTGRVAWEDVEPPLEGEIRYDLVINKLDIIKALGEVAEGFTVHQTSNRLLQNSIVHHRNTNTRIANRRTHYGHHQTNSWFWESTVVHVHRAKETTAFKNTYTGVHDHVLTTHRTHNKHLEQISAAPNDGHELTHHVTNVPGQGELTQVTRIEAGFTEVTEGLGTRKIQDAAKRATEEFYNEQNKLIEQRLTESFWDIPAYALANVAMQYRGSGSVIAKRKIDPAGDWTSTNVENSIIGMFANE